MRTIKIGLLAATLAAPLTAQTAPSPTRDWPRSTPEQQGLDAAPLNQLAERARSGAFGNVDRLVVVRNGYLVLNERFPRDYREISRGKATPIGCGIDACTDSAKQMHQFNYLHPNWHPYYQGRDVHTFVFNVQYERPDSSLLTTQPLAASLVQGYRSGVARRR